MFVEHRGNIGRYNLKSRDEYREHVLPVNAPGQYSILFPTVCIRNLQFLQQYQHISYRRSLVAFFLICQRE